MVGPFPGMGKEGFTPFCHCNADQASTSFSRSLQVLVSGILLNASNSNVQQNSKSLVEDDQEL
jgi:hypothetical protein